ncbi:hypothetical protein [Hyphomicrobium sp. 99]|uniref:hypothetical protein n=1 Tax=Hyphomicrobium sp. 99 TaxID=1163419 RepID=UPI000696211A|nr:hypothetical protein [Hyphomicrobium sp. 99]
MADLRAYQPSFTAGELSPALGARVDLAKYSSGLRSAVNIFVHPHGGASNRAGTEFVTEIKNSTKFARKIPFEFNTEQTYRLEFGDKCFRVIRDGGVILKSGAPYEVVTPYAHTDIWDLNHIQDADVMYLCHPDYPVQKIARLADDNWTITPVTFAPKITAPTGLAVSEHFQRKSGSNTNASFRVTAVNASGAESAGSTTVSRILQTEKEDGRQTKFTWNAVAGAVLYRLYRVNGDYQGLLVEVTTTEATIEQMQINGVDPQIPAAADSGAPSTPTGLAITVVYGKPMKYVISAVDGDTGEESLPSSPVTAVNDLSLNNNKNVLTWTARAGASAYIIYKESNGIYGYIGRSETTLFTDNNIVADMADGPQTGRNPFVGAGNYPRVATFIEQRLGFFSTKKDPQAGFLSQSANYENFGYSSPAKASDAVTFRIRSRQVNEIRGAIALGGLMLLTSGAEWVVSGGSNSDAITPSAIKIDPQGYRGSSRVQPVVVGNTVLFSQATGGVVRDFSYDFASNGYDGKDLTILARHLFEDQTIKAWGYAQAPYSIVWVVLENGKLCSLTYLKEHDVWAWTRHESGPNGAAIFEDVTVAREGIEDVPYFIVKRTIDGTEKRYIERLHSRAFKKIEDAFFVDCGLTYEGAPAKIITGLDHLKGQAVVALADGNVVRNLVVGNVTGGVGVVLPNAAKKVHVGLPMVATLETLNLDLGQVPGLGTVQGRQKSVSEVTLRVEKTRGIFVGPYDGDRNSEHLVEYKQRSTEAWDEAIALYTGDIKITPPWDWNDNGRVFVKQFDPLPMTILAIMPDVTVGK